MLVLMSFAIGPVRVRGRECEGEREGEGKGVRDKIKNNNK